MNGLIKLGFKENGGINSGSLIGFAQYPATLQHHAQIRDSSQTSFLERVGTTIPSLRVYRSTLAKKILFSGKCATGVQVQNGGTSYVLSAKEEVILAAGPVSSDALVVQWRD